MALCVCVCVCVLNEAPKHITANFQPSLLVVTLPVQEKVFKASVVFYIIGAWHITEPHSDRTVELGRDLWRSSGPKPLLKQGHLQPAA